MSEIGVGLMGCEFFLGTKFLGSMGLDPPGRGDRVENDRVAGLSLGFRNLGHQNRISQVNLHGEPPAILAGEAPRSKGSFLEASRPRCGGAFGKRESLR